MMKFRVHYITEVSGRDTVIDLDELLSFIDTFRVTSIEPIPLNLGEVKKRATELGYSLIEKEEE